MMMMMMNEPGELCQCLCHNDCSINVVLSALRIISRSHCYMIRYWHNPVVRLPVRPSVCLSVTLCIVTVRVGVQG